MQSHYSIQMPSLSISSLFPPWTSIKPPLEHRNRIRSIRRPRLRHVPMLNKARPIHPVNVRQRNGLLVCLIDAHVDEADVVVEAMAEDYGGHERNDCKRTR